ncbi:hypothetical protein [Alkaliphilus serpentinus]|uniref:Uncharacterized protein n=1 Tax=Alkaliphilus serpentinus TaxID=1482731 RepID=A0A833HN75_9FIRM|nr:hypothetical protein [Alkaliphilus serpentinus]KAB3529167.1 hypothetical protein F8153_10035 [Alkaliphilus serpentinus]
MRLIARFPHQEQASALIDSLINAGFDRKDMLVSRLGEEERIHSIEDAIDKGVIIIKTEREGLGELGSFADGIPGLEGKTGIIVAVEMSKHDSIHVREIMEESGAIEIIQD